MDSVDQRLEVALARRGRVVMIVTARCEDVQRADDAVLADAGRIARIALVRSQVDRVGTDQPSVVFGLDARLVVIEAERLVVAQSVRNEDVGHHDDRVSRQFDVDRLEAARVFVDNRRPRNVLEVAPLGRPERGIEVGVVRVHAVDLRRALSRHVRSRPRSSVDAHSVAVALGDTAGRLLCDQRRQTGHRIGVERSRQVVGHRHVVADQPGRAVVSPGERRLEQAVLPGAARGRLGERFVGVGLEGRRKGKPIVCAHPRARPTHANSTSRSTCSRTASIPSPSLQLVKTNGSSPRTAFVSSSITCRSASTCGARSVLLTTSRSACMTPGPRLRGCPRPPRR